MKKDFICLNCNENDWVEEDSEETTKDGVKFMFPAWKCTKCGELTASTAQMDEARRRLRKAKEAKST